MKRSLFNARAGAVLTIAAAIAGAHVADAQTRSRRVRPTSPGRSLCPIAGCWEGWVDSVWMHRTTCSSSTDRTCSKVS